MSGMESKKSKRKVVAIAVLAVVVVLVTALVCYLNGVFDRWGTEAKAPLITGAGYSITAKINGKYITQDDMAPWIVS